MPPQQQLSFSEISDVFGCDRFSISNIKYLQKTDILQDLVTTRRAFSQKTQQKHRTHRSIDVFDVRKL